MINSPIIVAARKFMALLDQPSPPRPRQLAKALDRMAAASHSIPRGRPAKRGKRWRDAPSKRRGPIFADPEYYAVVGPLEGLDQKPYHASMADDVGDISLTMAEALWRLEANGRADAHWFLRTMQHHWEMHLRELSLYLHAKRFRFPARRDAASEPRTPGDVAKSSEGGRDGA